MSEKTLQEQLNAVRKQLFPAQPISIDETRASALRLNSLVPNALIRALLQMLQACRAAPSQKDRAEHIARLEAVLTELASLRGDFLATHMSSEQRQLLEVAGPGYMNAVRHFKVQEQAHRREQTRLRKIEEHWSRWIDSLYGSLTAACTIAATVERPLQPLTEHDKSLCLAWSSVPTDPSKSCSEQWVNYAKVDPNDALRLWSARSAEIAAISFLSELGTNPVDVSIRQVAHDSSEWRTHDIEANGEFFDVKNSRKSFSSQDSYVEHTIPLFKSALGRPDSVTILGVVSDYVSWRRIETGAFGSATILGVLRRADLNTLASWMANHFGDILDFGLIAKSSLCTYPGWLFDYPEQWYSGRRQALSQVKSLAGQCPDVARAKRILPTYVHAFIEDFNFAEDAPNRDLDIFRQFTSLRQEIGISRGNLFGWILGAFLRALNDQGSVAVRDTAASLRRLLFASDDVPEMPAGIYDPQTYISNLISMFDEIGKNVRPELLRPMRFFKLTSPTRLAGRTGDGRWQTIFAHCGGWRSHPFLVPCGNNPIHLGNAQVCPECRFLICGACAHCLEGCSLREDRMRRHALEQSAVEACD